MRRARISGAFFLTAGAFFLAAPPAFAHPPDQDPPLDVNGGHLDVRTRQYHYHVPGNYDKELDRPPDRSEIGSAMSGSARIFEVLPPQTQEPGGAAAVDPHPTIYGWREPVERVGETADRYVFYYTGRVDADASVPLGVWIERIPIPMRRWDELKRQIVGELAAYYSRANARSGGGQGPIRTDGVTFDENFNYVQAPTQPSAPAQGAYDPRAAAEWTFYLDQVVLWQFYCQRILLNNPESVAPRGGAYAGASDPDGNLEAQRQLAQRGMSILQEVVPETFPNRQLAIALQQRAIDILDEFMRGFDEVRARGVPMDLQRAEELDREWRRLAGEGGAHTAAASNINVLLQDSGAADYQIPILSPLVYPGGISFASARAEEEVPQGQAPPTEPQTSAALTQFDPAAIYSNPDQFFARFLEDYRRQSKLAEDAARGVYRETILSIQNRRREEERYAAWLADKEQSLFDFARAWGRVQSGERVSFGDVFYLITKEPLFSVPLDARNIVVREVTTPQDLIDADGRLKGDRSPASPPGGGP